MYAPLFARFRTVFLIVLCALSASAHSERVATATDRLQIAQAESPAESAPALGDVAPATAPPSEEQPPPIKNKTAARWGVAFMLATSAVFAGFGMYVIYKSPNSLRNRAARRPEE